MVPVTVKAPRTRLADPLLVRTTDCEALVEPTVNELKTRLLAESVTAGAVGATPVPVRETLCGLPEALLLMLAVAALVPTAVGVNVTLNAQVAFGTNVALLHVFVATR